MKSWLINRDPYQITGSGIYLEQSTNQLFISFAAHFLIPSNVQPNRIDLSFHGNLKNSFQTTCTSKTIKKSELWEIYQLSLVDQFKEFESS